MHVSEPGSNSWHTGGQPREAPTAHRAVSILPATPGPLHFGGDYGYGDTCAHLCTSLSETHLPEAEELLHQDELAARSTTLGEGKEMPGPQCFTQRNLTVIAALSGPVEVAAAGGL